MKIPLSSISRISLYYRALTSLKYKTEISSKELAGITDCSAALIRKDLAYFGQFGTPGRGYMVEVLKDRLRHILGIDREWNVALVGVGNLGKALLSYKGFKKQGFNIKRAFDNDSKKINRPIKGLTIQHIKDAKKLIKSDKIYMAIVAVPQEAAQKVIDKLVFSGVKAILNFAPIKPKVPKSVEVLDIDLSMEFGRLTYFLKRG